MKDRSGRERPGAEGVERVGDQAERQVEQPGRSRQRPMQRLGDLLPDAARRLGLDDELQLATAMRAWQRILDEHVPAAVGACRLAGISHGVVTIECDEPIVAQEVRLRAPELTAALRSAVRSPVRQLRVSSRHV